MKILGLIAMTAISATTVFAGETGPARERKVTVCVDSNSDGVEIRIAQGLSSKLFARIGVSVDWHELRSCPAGGNALQVSLSYNTRQAQLPGSLAYALPYEGSHIVVFYDRIQKSDPLLVKRLLAYVLVHEVAHMLEGIVRHSGSGIMKAQWDQEDRFEIARGRLGFAPADVDLIYQGLDARELRYNVVAQGFASSSTALVAAHQ
jgi:hypothetical protein